LQKKVAEVKGGDSEDPLNEVADFDTSFCTDRAVDKLKYSKAKTRTKSYSEDYQRGVIPDKILLELIIQKDS
jgi:hypothetical protein